MNPDQLLQQLKPIHMPEPPGWWPLAPGWWLLLVLSILLIALLTFFCVRQYQKNLWRRQALARLTLISNAAKQNAHASNVNVLLDIEKLIKQVSRLRYKNHASSSLTGQAWVDFLKQHPEAKQLTEKDFELIAEGLYRPTSPPITDEFLQHIKNWIKAS